MSVMRDYLTDLKCKAIVEEPLSGSSTVTHDMLAVLNSSNVI